jgi:hypothetical protein
VAVVIGPVTDTPQAGLYKTRLVRGGPVVAVRIWHGLPLIDGEAQDRAPQWCVEIDGRTERIERDDDAGYRCSVPLDPMSVWPRCAAHVIDDAEYQFLLRRRAWAHEHAPDHPLTRPRRPVDMRALKPAF